MAPYVQLFGAPRVRLDGTVHVPPRTKADALLFYLAYRGEWCSRDEILLRFYADTPESVARNNLRQRLTAARRLPYNRGLEIEATRLRWPITTDVQLFRQALRESNYAQAADLYQGDLLEGVYLPGAPEFEAWLELEREKCRGEWRIAVLRLASDLEAAGEPLRACGLLERLYQADAYDEEVLRRYLQALGSGGQREKALGIFAAFKAQLRLELEGEPEEETLRLVEALERSAPKAPAAPAATPKREPQETQAPRHNLTLSATPFIGRQEEKTQLSQLLDDPSCRLLTLLGPGGMGKTRLATEIAWEKLERFKDGVFFVSFVPVTSPDQLAYTIGDALGLYFFGQQEPKAQLLDYLKQKELLLVLDNLEHLLASAHLIGDLLDGAPGLRVLATSRERLNLHAERVFDLYGLAIPDRGAAGAGEHDAVRLFVQRAVSARADFALDDTNLAGVIRICQLVQGLPLALELAASWLRTLTVSDIAAEIEGGTDLLETSMRDLPERHRSIRAVFDASWGLLTEKEQAALARLSVFQGGFRRDAAAEVAGASLPLLAALVDKSFLTLEATGRYRRHPLVIQYTREKLAEHPEAQRQAAQKHSLYYCRYIEEKSRDVFTERGREAYRAIDEDYINIRAAWQWLIAHGRIDEIRRYTFTLGLIFRHRPPEGERFFTQAMKALDPENPDHQRIRGYVLVQQSLQLSFLSHHEEAIDCARRSLDLLAPATDTQAVMFAQFSLGQSLWMIGEIAKARAPLTESLALARAHPEFRFTGYGLYFLALLEREFEPFGEVRRVFEAAIAEVEAIAQLNTLAMLKHDYGVYLMQHGHVQEGAKLAFDGFALLREIYDPRLESYVLANLVMVNYKLGKYREAEAVAAEAFALAETLSMKDTPAMTLAWLGRVALAQGKHAEAQRHLEESLRTSWRWKRPVITLHALIALAALSLAQGSAAEAAEWLGLVQQQKAFVNEHRLEVARLLEVLREQLPEGELEAALERGKSWRLERVLEDMLQP